MIRKGTLHEAVTTIQTKLAELGHEPGPADGWFGPLTARAVAAFQRAERLVEDAIVGPQTAKALGLKIDFDPFVLPPLRSQLTLAKLSPGVGAKLAKSSSLKAIHYEELLGLGYQPQLDRLEAIVVLKQSSGYLGNPCEGGSSEHVRFYIDRNADGTWTDLGVASFSTNDLPHAEPRAHAIHLQLAPELQPCTSPQLPRVRAILSWREVPPPNQPDWSPTWGNRVEARIQLAAKPKLVVPLSPLVAIELAAKFSLPKPALLATYAKQKIGPERFAAPKLRKLVAAKSFSQTAATGLAAELGLDLPTLATTLEVLPSGSTRYEQLDQVGYDADHRHLSAIVQVEQALGYSGDLCDAGSREFVRFWRWDQDDARWIDLGSSSVTVHDIARDGRLSYAVVHPVDLSRLRRPCESGPVIVRVRATLSWNEEPPANPEWVPTWGNRVEVGFDLEHGQAPTQPTLYVTAISNQAICQLGADGYYDDASSSDRPFGGDVMISGLFSHVDTLGPNRRLFYRVRATPPAGSAETLTNAFKVWLNETSGGVIHQQLVTQSASEGWYEYRERASVRVFSDMLALWHTRGDGLGQFELEAELRDAAGVPIATVECRRAECDEQPSSNGPIRVMIDNRAPRVSLTLQAGDCHTYTVGTTIHGGYEVEDVHLASFSLAVDGASPSGTLTLSPTLSSGSLRQGTWSLDTSAMRACGYVIRLAANDRTIVGSYVEGSTSANYYVSGAGYHASTPSSGFCIVAP